MAIEAGQQLLHYCLIEKIGEGGMGVVWKAVDTTLDREVAIKILPEGFVADAERLARFEREAKLLASVNHPNIATVYSVHESGPSRFLALELVEGEDLSQRLARGPLPIDETLEIAGQIAQALEAAHSQGVVHRDLKPANVMLAADDRVKVLDFGLAKALDVAPASGGSGTDPSLSPTITSLGTVAGVILGTAAYMSPEQARGKPVDPRADVWAFGCLLYEMLTGRRPFDGETISDTLAAVLAREPDMDALPDSTPPRVRRVLHHCLQKDQRRRFRDIGDVRIELEQDDGETAATGAAQAPRAAWLPWSLAALLGAASLVLLLVGFRGADEAAAPVRAEIGPPPGCRFYLSGDYPGPPVPSFDGTRVAFVAVDEEGVSRLYVRALDSPSARAIQGTEGAYFPFWSPDDRSLGFFEGRTLKRVDLDGGAPVTLADSRQGMGQGKGGSWSRDGVILFSPLASSGLFRVAATGGEVTPATQRDEARHTTHRWPHFLSDGRRFVYLAADHNDAGGPETGVYLGSLDGGEDRLLVRTQVEAIPAAGRLLYLRGDTLVTQRLDAGSGELVGDVRSLVENVQVDLTTWKSGFGATDELLVYVPRGQGLGMELQWFDRDGRRVGGFGAPANFQTIRISPDGGRLATETQVEGPNADIWIHDLDGGARPVRLMFTAVDEGAPAWSPDGEYIYYVSSSGDPRRIMRKRTSGAGDEEPVYETDEAIAPMDWSRDGRYLLLARGGRTDVDPIALDLWRPGDERTVPLQIETAPGVQTVQAQFSPDGGFIAYTSDVSGRREVYVVALRESAADGASLIGGKWQVSSDGGTAPRWRGDGSEIFYLSDDKTVTAVSVQRDKNALRIGTARPLFRAMQRSAGATYDVTADGQRFLVSTLGADAAKPLAFTTHWSE